MERKSFFAKKEGQLTIAFIIIMIAFIIMIWGVKVNNIWICGIGFGSAILAMLYSPLKTYILDKRKK